MEITYPVNERDVMAFNHYRLLTGPTAGPRVQLRRLLLAAAFALMGVAASMLSGQPYFIFIFGALAVLALIFYNRFWQWQIDRRIDAYYREHKLAQPNTWTLRATDEGLEQSTFQGDVRIRWSAVTGVDDRGAHTFISVAGQGAIFMIPHGGLPAEELSAFLDLVRSRMAAAKGSSPAGGAPLPLDG